MSGYTLFVKLCTPLYFDHRDKFHQLKAAGETFLHYTAYLWKHHNNRQKQIWSYRYFMYKNYPKKFAAAEISDIQKEIMKLVNDLLIDS